MKSTLHRFWGLAFGLALCLALCLAVVPGRVGAEPIERSAALPETTPWDLAALSEVPEFEWVDKGPVSSLLYAGEPYLGKPSRVFAYYASPSTLAGKESSETRFPAVVLIHGGGGTAFRDWVELWARRGYAAIAMDLAGHRPVEGKNAHRRENRERLENGGPGQQDADKFGRIGEPPESQWQYHAVAAVLRAHSLIRSFPEVDADRTAVTGISWGGYLTCIVAAVDSRFQAAVPVYGCGFLHENSAWLDRLNKMSDAERQRWIQLWDPSQYLPAIDMPILFVNGTNDFAYPLDSYMRSYQAVPCTKQLRITVKMPHGHPAGWAPKEIGWFIDHHLQGSTALPRLGPIQQSDERIQVPVESATRLKSATLHFTTGRGPVNKRDWESRAIELSRPPLQSEPPPTEATAWFITVTDARDATVSSEVFFQVGR